MHDAGTDVNILEEVDQIRSVNPNTGQVLGTLPVCSESQVRAAVVRARAAQPAWAARSLRERIKVMEQIQEALVDHVDDIVSLVSQEMGKGESEALVGDALLVLTNLTGYLKLAPKVLRIRKQRQGLLHSTKRTYIVPTPLGVVAVISPYNYPVLLTMQSTFAALLAGNAVVNKPSEYTSLTAIKIKDILYQTDLPRDLFQVVTGRGETGWALAHAGVDHIAFVGSCQTGRKIAGAAGEQLIPATLELGGNNAMIVLDDAQLDRAVDGVLTYAYAANGQTCGSVARLYVQEPVAEAFIRRLQTRMAGLRTATEVRPGACEITALVNDVTLAKVERHVQSALEGGARLLCGGERLEGTTAPIYKPTVLLDTSPDMEVMREETFGPVLNVVRVKDDDEALRLANATPYGLTASVWSRDKERAWKLACRLEVGTVAVNDHLWPFFAPEAPWGGIKSSGMGRIGGEWGLQSMTFPKAISYDRINLPREFYWSPRPTWMHTVFRQAIPLLYSRQIRKKLAALTRLISLIGSSR
ncbi:MAG: aldehyde dehydrogenase family protein [Anaerolineae bacterium]|nr:aldehyde dehydrogenase family protein [Anaerolineae bacterium]